MPTMVPTEFRDVLQKIDATSTTFLPQFNHLRKLCIQNTERKIAAIEKAIEEGKDILNDDEISKLLDEATHLLKDHGKSQNLAFQR
jgi:hypothetical protein